MNVDRNHIWLAVTGTAMTTTPASFISALLAFWVPNGGLEFGGTAGVLALVAMVSSITSACWIVDDGELRTYRQMSPEGRKEVKQEIREGEVQAREARLRQRLHELERQQDEDFSRMLERKIHE